MDFVREIYNLSSTWHDDKRTKAEVKKLKASVDNVANKLSAFTAGSKRRATDTGGDPSSRMSKSTRTNDDGSTAGGATPDPTGGTSRTRGTPRGTSRTRGPSRGTTRIPTRIPTRGAAGRATGDAAGRLEESGYELVPEFPESDPGTWGSIDKVQH